MTEYELTKFCEEHCAWKDTNCMKCPVFQKHIQEERNK